LSAVGSDCYGDENFIGTRVEEQVSITADGLLQIVNGTDVGLFTKNGGTTN
jgi:hypothetical protein